VELRRYRGPSFVGEQVHPELDALLAARDTLVEIGDGSSDGDDDGDGAEVLLGVPHHAAVGVDRIAERRPQGGRVADENAVVYALAALESLTEARVRCRLLVAAHATDHDPNKHEESPYCERILASPDLRLLIECHGSSHRAPHDLELSAGRNRRTEPLRFGRLLARALGPGFRLATQTTPGEREARVLDAGGVDAGGSVLRFPALRTRSLAAAAGRGIHALHLEAKPRFRSRGDGTAALTPPGRRLARALAAAIGGYLPATGSP
jgi:hypothetical protein